MIITENFLAGTHHPASHRRYPVQPLGQLTSNPYEQGNDD
jgi:hypothetical protein